MSTLIIKRTHSWFNRFRNYDIRLDGKKVVSIRNGETKEVLLNEGIHSIQVNMGYFGSDPLQVISENGKTRTLEIGCHATPTFLQNILSLLSLGLLISFVWVFDHLPLLGLGLILVLWIVRDVLLTGGKPFFYYLFKGRSKYLYIKDIATC